MKTTTKTQKTVTVLAVYKFNKVARICFETLSSNGNDHYHTCFQGNGRESCSCPSTSKKGCYHRDQLRERAQAYFESQKQQVSTPAATAEQVAAVAEQAAEAKMDAFKAAMDEQYASDPRRGLSQGEIEAARSNMVHLYDEY